MPTPDLTVSARTALLLLDRAQRVDMDPELLMERASISPSDIEDPDGRIPIERIIDLWRAIIEIRTNPALGVRLGQTITPRDLGLVGYTMLFSATLREALNQLVRYGHVLAEDYHLTIVDDGERATFTALSDPRHYAIRPIVETDLSAILTLARELTGTTIQPLETHFPHGKPEDLAPYREHFGGELHFDRSEPLIVFESNDLDRPIPEADPSLRAYLDSLADKALEALGPNITFTARVWKKAFPELSRGDLTLERVATLLNVSPRTLQRRLSEEGTTFQKLLDTLRRETAVTLLLDPAHSVLDVAYMLGYSEPSTFHRAFRRWKGASPHAYRKAHRAAPGSAPRST